MAEIAATTRHIDFDPMLDVKSCFTKIKNDFFFSASYFTRTSATKIGQHDTS